MVLRNIIGWASQSGSREIFKKKQAERASAEQEATRPHYTPEEEREIRAIWADPLQGKMPDYNIISSQIDSLFEQRPIENVRTLAYYCLKYGFNCKPDRVKKISDTIAANKKFFRGGIGTDNIIRSIIKDAEGIKEGKAERNWIQIILNNPEKYKKIFVVYRRHPPGVTEFMTEEEWNSVPTPEGR